MNGPWDFPSGRLLIFARAPVPGRVKTRLIPLLGARNAARLHARLLQRTLRMAVATHLAPVELWCAPAIGNGFFYRVHRDFRVRLRRQQGADLGLRMHHALRTTLREGKYAVVIGSDCPALTGADLHAAFSALHAGHDAVLGPAQDGGYVLIGLRKPAARLFQGMPWGGARVLARTRRRLARVHKLTVELATTWDIDRPADFRRAVRERLLAV